MSEDKNGKLLLIDDDEEYCLLVKDYMEFQNIMLDYALTGEAGFSVLGKRGYDLVLLDMMLPDVPGVEVLRRIRMKSSVPVIILSAHNDETDRIALLKLELTTIYPSLFPHESCLRACALYCGAVRVAPVKGTTRHCVLTA